MRAMLVAVVAAAAVFAQKAPKRDPVVLNGDKMAALGAHMAEDYRKRSQLLESPAAQAYVEAIGGCIAPYLPATASFTYTLMKNDPSEMHEPIALPGGYVFVPAGLFAAAENDSEFAAMLAHAMWHSVHPMRMPPAPNSASIPMIFVAPSIDGVVPLGFVKELHRSELQADVDIVKVLAEAGFDPSALRAYVSRDGDAKSRYSRYPAAADRAPKLQEMEAGLTRGGATCFSDLGAAKKEMAEILKPPVFKPPSLYNSSNR